jgi:drug/metabolite transporter (DMT)-like permease
MSIQRLSKAGDTRTPARGVYVAGITAAISGVSVFVNSYGVKAVASPAVYTTAKNLAATFFLALAMLVASTARSRRGGSIRANFATPHELSESLGDGARSATQTSDPSSVGRWLGLAYVGVIGGGLAFVLFFDGLAQSEPASAAFWRDTLVLWVAVLAVPFLRERIRWWNVAAVAFLIIGEVTFTGGVGSLAANRGEMYVLAATILWAIEVVIAKRLLRSLSPATISVVRTGVGAAALVVYLAATGALGTLLAFNAAQFGWAIWTGLLLGAYVATWMTALSRARALDVTSVLVASVLLTWLLQLMAGTASAAASSSLGLILIALGAVLIVWASVHRQAPQRRLTSQP